MRGQNCFTALIWLITVACRGSEALYYKLPRLPYSDVLQLDAVVSELDGFLISSCIDR